MFSLLYKVSNYVFVIQRFPYEFFSLFLCLYGIYSFLLILDKKRTKIAKIMKVYCFFCLFEIASWKNFHIFLFYQYFGMLKPCIYWNTKTVEFAHNLRSVFFYFCFVLVYAIPYHLFPLNKYKIKETLYNSLSKFVLFISIWKKNL